MVPTSKPSIAACNAQIGSTSVTITRAPPLRSDWAEPLPTSPKPATHATLPASITSVARRIASTSDSLHPYRLSNFDLVTLSLTLMAGNGRSPFLAVLVMRGAPSVGSSVTVFEFGKFFFRNSKTKWFYVLKKN